MSESTKKLVIVLIWALFSSSGCRQIGNCCSSIWVEVGFVPYDAPFHKTLTPKRPRSLFYEKHSKLPFL